MARAPFPGSADEVDDPQASAAARVLILAELRRIAAEADVRIVTLESGALELRSATGEVFHLGRHVITRIA